MPVPIIIAAAILAALVVMIVLYRRARRSPLFGDSLAFPMIFFARPLVKAQGMLEKGAVGCEKLVEKTLLYPYSIAPDTPVGVLVIAWSVLLLVCSIILSADVYNMLERLPLLFGGAGAVDLPGSFAIPSSLLFVCMSALYGSVILECVGLLPSGVGLFPKITGKVKKWLGILCAIGFGLSVVFAVLFWVIAAYYTSIDPSTPAWLTIPALGIVGVILTGASVLALWGWVLGLLGFCSVVFLLLAFGLHILAGIVSIVPSLADVYVQHMTQGRLSVYGDLLGHEPYKPPASPFPQTQSVLSSQQVTMALPEPKVSVETELEVVPIDTPRLEETKNMNVDVDKNAFISCIGEYGGQMFPPVVQAIERLNAKDNVLNWYFLERALTNVNTSYSGIHDLSHTTAEKNLSMLHARNEDEADKLLFGDLTLKIAENDRHLLAIPASFVNFIDSHKIVTAIDMFEAIAKRFTLFSQVLVTSVSQHDLLDKGVQTGLADCIELWKEGFLDGVVLVFSDAEFTMKNGLMTRNRFVAQAFVSMLQAHKQHPNNPHFSNVFGKLNQISPFIGMSFASQRVVVGEMPKRFAWIPGMKNQAGTGIYSNILTECRETFDQVLTEEDTRAFPSSVRTIGANSVLVNIPVPLNDVKFAPIARENSLYINSHYPLVQSIATVRGNGIPYPTHLNGRFLVSACALHPLELSSLQSLQSGRKTKRVAFDDTNVTPLYPMTAILEPSSKNGNGHVPVDEQKVTKAKKPATTRRKKTSATGRVARNTATKQVK